MGVSGSVGSVPLYEEVQLTGGQKKCYEYRLGVPCRMKRIPKDQRVKRQG